MSDTAILVQNVSKCFHIYDAPRDRVKQLVLPSVRRLAGKLPKQYFREFWALKEISFEIKKGETVGIIGRNGSGKSTLLQMICGTLNPTCGNIQTNGRIAALLELGSGFNPQFTGRENVYLNGALLGLSKQDIDNRFDDIAAFADIGDFIEQPVRTYSSGMFVRLAFSVNILCNPEIMIVDEALSVGDMSFQAKCMTALTRIQKSGATVLFVSHDIGALKSLCSRGIYLESGKVKKIGHAGEVAEQYIRRMREEMNEEFASQTELPDTNTEPTDILEKKESAALSKFKNSNEFEKKFASSRYGDGSARITFAELLDEDMSPISEARFNQSVFVSIYFEALSDIEISCNYYILDDKKNLILGAGLRLVGQPLIKARNGGKYIVTYKTRLPLQEGNYNIQLQLATPIVLNHTARFLDVIDDALVFKMSRREDTCIWTKVYVKNEVEVESCVQD